MSEADKLSVPRSWLVPVIVAAITVGGGGVFGLMQAQRSSQPDLVRAITEEGAEMRADLRAENARLRGRIDVLTEELESTRALLTDAGARLNAALLQVSASISTTPRAAIKAFLLGLRELPAWCNEYIPEEDTVRMMFPNPAYEQLYDKTALAYEGKTPIDVWGPVIGGEYLKNDLRIIETKSSEIVTETVTAGGNTFPVRFVKLHVRLPGNVDLACGIQLHTIEYVRKHQGVGFIGYEAANDSSYELAAARAM